MKLFSLLLLFVIPCVGVGAAPSFQQELIGKIDAYYSSGKYDHNNYKIAKNDLGVSISKLEDSTKELSEQEVKSVHFVIDYLFKKKSIPDHPFPEFNNVIYRLLLLAPNQKYNQWLIDNITNKTFGDLYALQVLEKSANEESIVQVLELAIKYIQGTFKPSKTADNGNKAYWDHLCIIQTSRSIDVAEVICRNKKVIMKDLKIQNHHIEEILEPFYLLEGVLCLQQGFQDGNKSKSILYSTMREKMKADVPWVTYRDETCISQYFFMKLVKNELLIIKE